MKMVCKQDKKTPGVCTILALVLYFLLFLPWFQGHGRCADTNAILQVMERVQRHYAVTDFEADFAQESHLDAIGITDTAQGHVWFKPPAMMRWHYQRPDDYFVIANGDKVWIYRPTDNQVMVGLARDYFADRQFTEFFAEPKSLLNDFDVQWASAALQRPGQDVLRLVPHKRDASLAEVFLFVSKSTSDISKAIIFNAFGDQTTIRFSGFKFNQGLDRSTFEFKIPRGTDVVELDAP